MIKILSPCNVFFQMLALMILYEIFDITFLKSLNNPYPTFHILQFDTFSSTRSCGHKLKCLHSYCNLSRHFFFTRLSQLWNRLPVSTDLTNCSLPVAKKRLYHVMWSSFVDHFNNDDVCTFHFYCPYDKCIVTTFSH